MERYIMRCDATALHVLNLAKVSFVVFLLPTYWQAFNAFGECSQKFTSRL
jgi:hypothetical protein